MKNIKKILIFFLITFLNIGSVLAVANEDIKNSLLEQDKTIFNGVSAEYSGGAGLLDIVFVFVKESLSNLLLVTVIGVFLFIGMRLVIARGNPEEFKKAMTHFVYVAIGMFVVSVAYAAVKLVAGIDI